MALIAIVDYGMGNIHSVERALRHAAPEADIRLCSQPRDILAADRVVFPGQGAMADCIRTLDEAGLREAALFGSVGGASAAIAKGMIRRSKAVVRMADARPRGRQLQRVMTSRI